jgi:hypothetical protein
MIFLLMFAAHRNADRVQCDRFYHRHGWSCRCINLTDRPRMALGHGTRSEKFHITRSSCVQSYYLVAAALHANGIIPLGAPMKFAPHPPNSIRRHGGVLIRYCIFQLSQKPANTAEVRLSNQPRRANMPIPVAGDSSEHHQGSTHMESGEPGPSRFVRAFTFAQMSVDYQFVNNPAYNRDCGPVSVFGLRLHSQF